MTPSDTADLSQLDDAELREHIAAELTRTRQRSTALTDAVDEPDLVSQHSPLMSPLVWDYAHIANQEEIWLVRDVGGREAVRADIDSMYDAFKNARADRPSLPLLSPSETRSYVGQVGQKVLEVLDRAPLNVDRLTRAGFAFGMVIQHEQQHDETMLATHQLRRSGPPLQAPPPTPPVTAGLAREVLIPAGPFTMGTSTEAWALDNERPAHPVQVEAFHLDTTPVTNGDYLRFLSEGGYDERRWWSEAGLGVPPAGGPDRAAVLDPRRRRLVVASQLRQRWSRWPPTSRWCTCACTRHRPTPPGPAGGCPPRPSGRRRPAGIRSRGGPGATRGATRTRRRNAPTSASGTCARRRPAATRPARRPTACTS